MKNAASGKSRRTKRIILYIAGSLLVLVVAGYFIAGAVIRRKLDAALQGLPASMSIHYGSLHTNIFTGSLDMREVEASYMPSPKHAHRVSVDDLTISGFSLFGWLRSHKVRIDGIRATGVTVDIDVDLLEKDSAWKQLKPPAMDLLVDRINVDSIRVEGRRKDKREFSLEANLRLDSVTRDTVGEVYFLASRASYVIPGMDETVYLRRLEADSKKELVTLDSVAVRPNLEEEKMGRLKGHQVDVFTAAARGIEVTGIEMSALAQHRFQAAEISLQSSRIHVFRDRRLPLEPGDKAMPVEGLESMPVDLRVGKVRLGATRFEYEEFPKVGDKTGMLVIKDFRATIEPLINKPRQGDPAFITMTTEGSLMGSGSVTATTRMPFHKSAFYEVSGAFHDLDVTRLNNPAENLGQLHLESGMLNSLAFQFEMGEERSTGKIVGEYHDLVVDKLKLKGGDLKTDKLKSFALKKFIIPKDKDKSLAVSKRTGKVNYKRDRQRYFSYYLLHSLLVGVKSSFSLGFLLPG